MNRGETLDLQNALLSLGYRLPRYGADGYYGGETGRALEQFCHDHDVASPEAGALEFDAAVFHVGQIARRVADVGPFPGVDCRSAAEADDVAGRRKWTEIDSILLHQMAVVFGGDKHRRIPQLAINGAVTVDGEALRIHDPPSWVWHAQGFSERSIGIEIEGWYAGVDGDDSTFWRPASKPNRQPMSLTDEMVDAALNACRWYCRIVEAHGGRVTKLLTHRQAYPTKPSDPGESIYRWIGLPLIEEFGLTGQDEYRAAYSYRSGGRVHSVRPGRPVPREWDASQPHDYRFQPQSGGVDKRGNPV